MQKTVKNTKINRLVSAHLQNNVQEKFPATLMQRELLAWVVLCMCLRNGT